MAFSKVRFSVLTLGGGGFIHHFPSRCSIVNCKGAANLPSSPNFVLSKCLPIGVVTPRSSVTPLASESLSLFAECGGAAAGDGPDFLCVEAGGAVAVNRPFKAR